MGFVWYALSVVMAYALVFALYRIEKAKGMAELAPWGLFLVACVIPVAGVLFNALVVLHRLPSPLVQPASWDKLFFYRERAK